MNESDSVSPISVRGLLLVVVANVALCSGIVSAYLESFPYPQTVQPASWALEAYKSKAQTDKTVYETGLWTDSERRVRSVAHHDKSRTSDGYVLYSAGHETAARLISKSGTLLHRWEMPVDKQFPNADSRRNFFVCRRAHVFPNGDLLAIYINILGKHRGSRLVRLDADSALQWSYDKRVHHDFAPRNDEGIYVLVHRERSTFRRPVPGVPQLPRYVLEDRVVQLDEDGDPLKSYNLLDLLADSNFSALLRSYGPRRNNPMNEEERWDVLHANDIDIVGERFARHHHFVDRGDLLISFRTPDFVILFDPQARKIVWGSRGYWIAQHDPDPRPNGNLLVFDNRGHGGVKGMSRLLEFDPATRAIDWSYRGSREHPFGSNILGSQDPLPNGNILVTSSTQGRIFEIDRQGDIVWEFREPIVERWNGESYSPTLVATKHVPQDYLSFEFDRAE